jgi:signal transduction histidine kinase
VSVLLGRLRVRQKLVLLVVPLLALAIVGAVPLVAGRVQAAQRSGDSAQLIQRAVRITGLVQALQLERLSSLGYLDGAVSRDSVVARSAKVLELARQLGTDYGSGDDRLLVAVRQTTNRTAIDGVRLQVLEKRISGAGVYSVFTDVITDLIGILSLTDRYDLHTDAGRQQLALDSIVRHDEATAGEGAALFIEPGRRVSARVIAQVSAGLALEDREEDVFKPLADPTARELYEGVEDSDASTRLNDYLDRLVESPANSIAAATPLSLLTQVESVTQQSRSVETGVAKRAVDQANRSAARDRLLAGLGVGIALLLLVAAGVLSVLITRSIVRPLRRLTASADEVADVAQQELVRVADTDDPEEAVPQLRPVQVGTADEMGELAQAFNRVQQVASSLVERQLVSRQNVATMFGNVGRRTQNLVGRQLAMIDSLERNEQDPALLDRLYRLDHVSTRLRRNANSLVVLSGATDQQITGEPLTVADTIRSALGEIEGFQRVRLGAVDSALLTPNVTPDVILLLAELLENGTSFSPPHTEVEVDAQSAAGGGVTIRIVDHGLGMTTEQLAAENGRLVSRERLDLAPTDVLGLFVAGRLARRHGIEVLLAPTPGTGVTAEVRVPARHVVRSGVAPAVVEPVAAPSPSPLPSPASAGERDGRGWWDSPAGSGSAESPFRSVRGEPADDEAGGAVADEPVEADGVAAARDQVASESAPASAEVRVPADAEVRTEAGVPAGAETGVPAGAEAGVPAGAEVPAGAGVPAGAEAGVPAGAEAPVETEERAPSGTEVPVGVDGLPVASEAEVARDVPRPRGTAGMVRRVRGAQHPDTGAPRQPEPALLAAPESADDARQGIMDFEEGVRRALRETGADGGAGFAVDPEAGVAPWTELDPDDPASVEQTRARLQEFENGVRQALARLDEVAARSAPPAPLFEAANGVLPAPRRSSDRSRTSQQPPLPAEPAADRAEADPAVADRAASGPAAVVDRGAADAAVADLAVADPAAADRAAADRAAADPAVADRAAADRAAADPAVADRAAAGPAAVAGSAALPSRRESVEQPRSRRESGEEPRSGREPADGPLPRRRSGEGVPLVPRRLDAGSGATRSEPAGRGRPDPRPLERRRPPDGAPAGTDPILRAADAAVARRAAARARAANSGPGDDRAARARARATDAGPGDDHAARDRAADPGPSDDHAVRAADPAARADRAADRGPGDDRVARARAADRAARDGARTASAAGPDGNSGRDGLTRRNGHAPTAEPGPAGSRSNETSPNGRTGRAADTGKLDSAADRDLVRRVPGAQMPAGARGARPGSAAPAAGNGADPGEQDASAARSLIEEFEAGVQRALQLGGAPDDRGTAGTDEEDAR